MLFEALTRELFIGDIETLGAQLKDLSEKERSNLYKQFEPLIDKLYEMLVNRRNKEIEQMYTYRVKNYDIALIYQWYQTDADQFLQQDWFEQLPYFTRAELGFYDSTSNYDTQMRYKLLLDLNINLAKFLTKLRMLMVGLGNQRSAEKAFKKNPIPHYTMGHYFQELAVFDQTILWLGRTLLDRNIAWNQSLLIKLSNKINNWHNYGFKGFTQLILEARNKYPKWQDQLKFYYGKAMLLDGFTQSDWPQKFPLDLILAGFAEQSIPRSLFSGLRSLAIHNNNVVTEASKLLSNEDQVARAPFIELALKELLMPHKPGVITGWVKFFQALSLTLEEKIRYQSSFIDLTQSTTSEVAQLGLRGITELWQQKHLSSEDIIAPLCIALQNQVQITATSAFQLLKNIFEINISDRQFIINNFIDALHNPHRTLRLTIIKWLKGHSLQLSTDNLTALSALLPLLNISEQEVLKEVLSKIDINIVLTIDNGPDEEIKQHNSNNWLNQLMANIEASKLQNSTQQHWYQYLKNYLSDSKNLSPLPSLPKDLNQPLEHNFPSFQSAKEMINSLVKHQQHNRDWTALEFERWIEGILKFHDEINSEDVKEVLNKYTTENMALCADSINFLQENIRKHIILNGVTYPETPVLSWYAELPILAYIWQYRDANEPLQEILNFNVQLHTVGNCNYYFTYIHQFSQLIKWLKKGIKTTPLAIPTNISGWIDPAIFVERFTALDREDIDLIDLCSALYRLPLLPESLTQAWDKLKDHVQDQKDVIDRIICLALGDDKVYQSSLDWFISYFQEYPPSLTIYHDSFNKPKYWQQIIKHFFLTHNLVFQAFLAALRVRFGLTDLEYIIQAIPRDAITYCDNNYISSPLEQESAITDYKALRQATLDKLLFNPTLPIRDYIKDLPSRMMYSYSRSHVSPIPYLTPQFMYLRSNWQFGWGQLPLSYTYPASTQLYFQLFIKRIKESLAGPGNFFLRMDLNSLNYHRDLKNIEVSDHDLSVIASMLSINHIPTREHLINILLELIFNGECTPDRLATILASVWHELSKGDKYFVDALISLGLATRAGNLFPLSVIEKFLIKLDDNVPTKKLTMALKLLEQIIGESRSLRDIEAINQLEKLAANKKSSNVKSTANHLLNRMAKESMPLEIEIIGQLLGNC